MERKRQEKAVLYEKEVYKTELLPDKWSIIIMPDNIVIDNYHNKEPHIHPNPENHREQYPTKSKTLEECYYRVIEHLHKYERLNKKELINDL
ncbi:MAG: conserved hypothetical protein [Methanobrevibacter sp. CfCl-M3]